MNRIPDPAIETTVVDTPVGVYFPTAPVTTYQLDGWAEGFRALDDAFGLTVICRDSRVAAQVRETLRLRAVSVATHRQLIDLLDRSAVRLLLYPNLDPLDFEPLADPRIVHVYVGHGDSDKTVFSSRQTLAFDHYFVADGSAARRVGAALERDLPEGWLRTIGPTGLDPDTWAAPVDLTRPVVVYAPTWEGGAGAGSHTSLLSGGLDLLERLLGDGTLRVVYRPHPLTGVDDARVRAADRRARSLVERAGHRVGADVGLEEVMAGSAALVADVSAVVGLWRDSGRPLVLTTEPGVLDAATDVAALVRERIAAHDYSLPVSGAGRVPAELVSTCADLLGRSR